MKINQFLANCCESSERVHKISIDYHPSTQVQDLPKNRRSAYKVNIVQYCEPKVTIVNSEKVKSVQ